MAFWLVAQAGIQQSLAADGAIACCSSNFSLFSLNPDRALQLKAFDIFVGVNIMRLKLGSILLLIIVFGCGGNNAQHSKSFKLPSGRQIKVTGVGKMDFPNSGSALVMNYETDIPSEEKVALRKEVDEIWELFQKDVEAAQLKAGVIRASHVEGSGFVKSGKGYGFVFTKRDDGRWHCLEDDKK